MIKKGIIVISVTIMMICSIFVFTQSAVAKEKWDPDSTSIEHRAWDKELDRWKSISKNWYDKVESNQYTPPASYTEPEDGCDGNKCWENTPTSASYCISDKCWESNPITFKLIDFDGNSVEIWKYRCAMNSDDWFMSDGNKWNCGNGNQVNEFIGKGKERWKSGNYGQILLYVNKIGDKWESSNFGQEIIFKGVNGEKWESSNFGQGVEHVDKSGEKWEGSKYDTKDNF